MTLLVHWLIIGWSSHLSLHSQLWASSFGGNGWGWQTQWVVPLETGRAESGWQWMMLSQEEEEHGGAVVQCLGIFFCEFIVAGEDMIKMGQAEFPCWSGQWPWSCSSFSSREKNLDQTNEGGAHQKRSSHPWPRFVWLRERSDVNYFGDSE